MLRASSKATTGERLDTAATVQGEIDGVPHGQLLVGFVDAVVGRDPLAADAARAALAEAAGPVAVVDAAAVLANFEMMTRVADGTGAHQLPERLATLTEERARLGIDGFESAR